MVTVVSWPPLHLLIDALTHREVPQIPEWPGYASNATNFVFRKDQSYIEEDDDRAEGVAYINTLTR
jgi:hypothetical protein